MVRSSRPWPVLESAGNHLLDQSPPVMTYNRMFALFGENNPENLQLLPDPAAAIVAPDDRRVPGRVAADRLLAARQPAEIRRAAGHAWGGAQHSSLLCVGDDWQSIYGWRGSSPKYFMEFTKAFPSPATTRVMLVDNYRSQQHIIDAAEHIVKGTPRSAGKKAKASGRGRAAGLAGQGVRP
jgi:superfamily I DNA/RNA helicase